MKNNQNGEPILEPDLPIGDAHHHLHFREAPPKDAFDHLPPSPWRKFLKTNKVYRYPLDEYLGDVSSGHNIRATVFLDSRTMYRAERPEEMKSVGEVEFACGVAAMAQSGKFGDVKVCAGIIGDVLSIDEHAGKALKAHIHAGGGRYRSLDFNANYDPDPAFSRISTAPGVLLDKTFRLGYQWLHRLGLSFDVNLYEPQLPDLIDLARSFPDTQIVLNHIAGPLGMASYAGKKHERFPIWCKNIKTLAKCDNVAVKLGGLGGYPFDGFKAFLSKPRATSQQLAEGMAALHRTLYRSIRCPPLHVRERCAGSPGELLVRGSVERLQTHCGGSFKDGECSALQRDGDANLQARRLMTTLAVP